MKTSKKIFKLEQTDKVKVFLNKIPVKTIGDNRNSINPLVIRRMI